VIVDEMNDYYDVTMKESGLNRLWELYLNLICFDLVMQHQ